MTSVVVGRFNREPSGRAGAFLGCAGVALVAAVIPFLFSRAVVGEATTVLTAVVAALALQLVTGLAGQFSLGSAALMAIGAFTVGIVDATAGGVPFLVLLLLAGLVGAVVGLFVGLPALRLRGLYLIVATLALHYIVIYALQQHQTHNVGPVGYVIRRPAALSDDVRWYFFLLTIAVVVTVMTTGYKLSRTGAAMMMMTHNEFAAEAIGINTRQIKLFAFVVSSAITSFLGGVTAYTLGVVTYQAFDLDSALMYVAIVIVAGLGSATATWLGAAFIIWVPTLATRVMSALLGPDAAATNVQTGFLVYGLLIVFFMMFVPGGLHSVVVALARRVRHLLGGERPESGRQVAEPNPAAMR